MSNTVEIKVTGTNTSGVAVKTAREDVKKLGEEAKDATPKLAGLTASETAAGRAADQMGDQFDGAKRDAGQLMARVLELKASTKLLAEEFNRTGDIDIFKTFTKQTTELNKTIRLGRVLDPQFAKAGQESASTFAAFFQGGLLKAVGNLPPEVKLAIANAIGAAVLSGAAVIGAAVNGAILAGIGTGGIAAGIAGQADDPRVRDAWKGFVDDIGEDFSNLTEPFARPAAYSANIFRTEWRRMLPGLEHDLEGLSKFVVPLASGLAQALSNMGPGLSHALEEAGPLLQVVADELPKFGREVSKALDDLADSSEGAADGIRFLFLMTETLIVGTAKLISGLSTLFHWIVVGTDDIAGFVDVLLGWVPVWGKIFEGVHNFTSEIRNSKDHVEDLSTVGRELSKDAAVLGREFYNTADAANAMNDAFDSLFGQMMSQDEANLKVKQGLIDLKEELRDGKRTLDTNTQAGIDNVEGIYKQINALNDKREADIRAGNGTKEATAKANAAYAAQIQSIRAMLIQMGFIPAEVDKILAKYAQIPRDISTTIHTYYDSQGRNIQTDAGLREERRYGKIFGGIVGAAATGGIRSGMTKVGEGGWEYAKLPIGTMMYSHANSVQMDALASAQAAQRPTSAAGQERWTPVVAPGGDSRLAEFLHALQRDGILQFVRS